MPLPLAPLLMHPRRHHLARKKRIGRAQCAPVRMHADSSVSAALVCTCVRHFRRRCSLSASVFELELELEFGLVFAFALALPSISISLSFSRSLEMTHAARAAPLRAPVSRRERARMRPAPTASGCVSLRSDRRRRPSAGTVQSASSRTSGETSSIPINRQPVRESHRAYLRSRRRQIAPASSARDETRRSAQVIKNERVGAAAAV